MHGRLTKSVAFACMLMLTLALSACGFALRGAATFPFKSIYLTFPDNSSLGGELKRNIRANGSTTITTDPKQADVIMEVLGETREKVILSLNNQGRVREYNLLYTLRFRVRDNVGREFLGPTEISLKRNISFNETQVLAKEAEEAILYRDMQSDLVQQVIRRLAVLNMEQ